MEANRRVFSWKVGRLPPSALLHTPQGQQGWKFWAEFPRDERIFLQRCILRGSSTSLGWQEQWH